MTPESDHLYDWPDPPNRGRLANLIGWLIFCAIVSGLWMLATRPREQTVRIVPLRHVQEVVPLDADGRDGSVPRKVEFEVVRETRQRGGR